MQLPGRVTASPPRTHALSPGYDVDVLEAADRPGGMAAHFDFGDLLLQRFYHFCCKTPNA
jgi:protoporphyrinogen oxidase